jgi:hypothetical protein
MRWVIGILAVLVLFVFASVGYAICVPCGWCAERIAPLLPPDRGPDSRHVSPGWDTEMGYRDPR